MENLNINSAIMIVCSLAIGGSIGVGIAENYCDGKRGTVKDKCLHDNIPPYITSGMLMGASLGLIADYMLNNVEFQ